jgi:hypothetical protein
MARKVHHKYFTCPSGMTYCTNCDSYKPFDDFHKSKNGPVGRSFYCKSCSRARDQKYKPTRALRNKEKYGISGQEYLEMWNAQGGVCAICGNAEMKIHRGTLAFLSVDHNHQNGKVRGLLCSTCNAGLGAFRDDRELIAKALDYLHSNDEERTQNSRPSKAEKDMQEMQETIEELGRAVRGFPKQLQGDSSDINDLPLFSSN